MTNFELRAVITALETGYVVSISKLSNDGDVMILSEEEVGDIASAHELMGKIAAECRSPIESMNKLYNIHGSITTKPPRGLT